ncbi:MAG: hypothetical protein IJD91_06195 [Clostridia bacterium]|nr:hypothetical protein [Clostridia bacterium]
MAYRFDIILSILKPIWFLPELSQFRVLKAAISFLQNEKIPTLEDAENVAFRMLLPTLEQERDKEKKRVEVYRRNGQNGGRGKTKKTKAVILVSGKEEMPLSSPSPTPPTTLIPKEEIVIDDNNAHAREESFDLKVGVLASEEGYIRRYQQEGLWEDAAMSAHLTIPQVQQVFDQFVVEQKHNSSKHSDYPDFKRHFLNYLRVKAEILRKQSNNGNNRPDYSRRGRADVPADISVDF